MVECSNCSKVCCIYAMYYLISKQTYKLSREEQSEKLKELEVFKDSD